MDIKIPDKWLREYLHTKASPREIAKYLSLCGPSVEKIEKVGNDALYSIEVTTNRVDAACVYGIAREAAAILPRFNIKASLQSIKLDSLRFSPNVDYLNASVDYSLCSRFAAVLIKGVEIKESPIDIQRRLNLAGIRPINNVVDISNYIMIELGQPVHTFDYDKIRGHKMVLRPSRKGEKLTTLDGKSFELPGGDIVIEDGDKRLIDLAGIMGGENSAVDTNTKNVLLFVQTYNPVNIRRTSMALAQRTLAAVLFEKGLDSELVAPAIGRGIKLFSDLTGGVSEREILDIYPRPYRVREVTVTLDFIEQRMGLSVSKQEISKILSALGFKTTWRRKTLLVEIPSFRAKDVEIPEDIVEEIARIYGYHKLPSRLMEGRLPEPPAISPFNFEYKLKNILKGYGGTEVYTSSLVSRELTDGVSLKLKNPLGAESEFLRTTLRPSLIAAAKGNSNVEAFHLFEMAHVYLPIEGNLPEEKMILAGIFSGYDYREAKGIIESLFGELNTQVDFRQEEKRGFTAARRVAISSGKTVLGEFGEVGVGFFYYEFAVGKLLRDYLPVSHYQPLPKYPAQVEDLTLTLPEKTKVGEIVRAASVFNPLITQFALKDIYKNAYTFRIAYQSPTKTLTDAEVASLREKISAMLKRKFGALT